MTPNQFRKIALSIPDAVESEHMGHPDFRVSGKVFASLGAPSDEWGMVKLTPEQQIAFLESNAESFQPCSGAWGRQGYTNIKLAAANAPVVRSVLTLAIENVTASLPAKQRAANTATPRQKPSTEKTARPLNKTTVTKIQSRIVKLVESLPEAQAVPAGEGHLSLEVRRKRFGWFLVNHHGDGRVALNCRAPVNASHDLLQLHPNVFHIPKYVGNRGWIGIWLDAEQVNWEQVATILTEAFGMTAPERLVAIRRQGRLSDTETP